MQDKISGHGLRDVCVVGDGGAALSLLGRPNVGAIPFWVVGLSLVHPPDLCEIGPRDGLSFERVHGLDELRDLIKE